MQVVRWAGAAGLGQVGTVLTAGTNSQGTASRHQALERVRAARAALVTAASQPDAAAAAARGSRRGAEVPAERARRAPRLATIEAAMQR